MSQHEAVQTMDKDKAQAMINHYEVLLKFLNDGNLSAAVSTIQQTTTLPDKLVADIAKLDKQQICIAAKKIIQENISTLKSEHDIK